MASFEDKKTAGEVTQEVNSEDVSSQDGNDNLQVEVVKGSEALAAAIRKEKPHPFSPNHCKLYVMCALAFLCSTMNGFDGSLLNGILALKSFQDRFNVGTTGSKAGLFSGMYTIGGAAALPLQGPLTDMYGRRFGMFVGCAIVIVGTVISATGLNEGAFLAGRFLLGLGVSIASGAAPAYVVEIAPPAYRGKLTGLYNCTWWVGAITAAGCLRGTVDYPGNQNWRIPVWMQLLTSSVVCIFVFFIPESPRWLFSHGRKEEAFKIITKYHGEGNPENEFVKLQMREFEAEISLDGSDKRWWDYRSLFDTKPHQWRVGNLIMMDFMGQWAGNGVVSYYLPAMLETAGVTNTTTILNINLGNSLVSAAGAYIGAFGFVGILGRRQMLIGGMIFSSIAFAVIATGTGIYHIYGYNSAATAGIAFIFIFGFCYSFNITPLQALYPVEVLAYEQRGKGMALHSLCINLALLLNNFAWPVAMKKIGWYTYLIFVGWDLVQAGLAYLFMVETNHRTLEELGEIYAAPNPRRASTEKKKVYVDPNSKQIVGVKGGEVEA